MLAALVGLAALGMPAEFPFNLANGPIDAHLTSAEKARLSKFAVAKIQEMAGCSDKDFAFSADAVISATQSICGHGNEAVKLTLETTNGLVTVTILEEVITGDLHLDWIEPFDFLPTCVTSFIEAVIEAQKNATAPANADEAAEFVAEEASLQAGSTAHFKVGHPAVAKLKKAQQAPPGTYRAFRSARHSTKYALGLTSNKTEALADLSQPVRAEDSSVYVAALASEYSALDGSPCLTGYSARNQGSCGSNVLLRLRRHHGAYPSGMPRGPQPSVGTPRRLAG